jgi:hypothetical protein
MKTNLYIVSDLTYKRVKFNMKLFILWATQKWQILLRFEDLKIYKDLYTYHFCVA